MFGRFKRNLWDHPDRPCLPNRNRKARVGADRVRPMFIAQRVQGFTLLEVLTAMALFFMVAGILASGVVQAIRVAEVGAVETTNARDQLMRLQWFRETVGLTILPPNNPKKLDRTPPLVGDARKLSGMSIQSHNKQTLAPAQYQFELKFDPSSGETKLYLIDLAPEFGRQNKQSDRLLAAWPGSEGRFRYLDDHDQWLASWPERTGSTAPTDFSRSQLPKAVELQYGAASVPLKSVVVAIQDRALPLPSMRDLMQ